MAEPAAMSLARFIATNLDTILAEWERFARTLLPSAATMDSLALRDHARQILETIAKDIVVPQTTAESGDKSKGKDDCGANADTAAAVHGGLRHDAGFDLTQLFAEYRALRASVLRLWSERQGAPSPDALYQMTRFNEAIDQALAESVARYSNEVERSRDTFIAVLGDDLRTPLQVVHASAASLAQRDQPAAAQAEALARIPANVLRMNRVIDDLLEYTRTRLGRTIPIKASGLNVEAVVWDALDEVSAAHPQASFRAEVGQDLVAPADRKRLQQAITNLLMNAVEHGRPGSSIGMIAQREADGICIQVVNSGPTLSPEVLQVLFDPMLSHGAAQRESGTAPRPHLGLGLFIAREIAAGHGGSIDVNSEGDRTSFVLRIPFAQAGERQPAQTRETA